MAAGSGAAEEADGGLAGTAADALEEGPAGGGEVEFAGVFEDEDRIGGGRGDFQEVGEEARGDLGDDRVGRVDEDEVGRGVLGRGAPGEGVAGDELEIAGLAAGAFGDDGDVLAEAGGGLGVLLDEDAACGAAAPGFEAVAATAGEEIGEAGVEDAGAEGGEDCLAHAVGGGAHGVAFGHRQDRPARCSAADSHRAGSAKSTGGVRNLQNSDVVTNLVTTGWRVLTKRELALVGGGRGELALDAGGDVAEFDRLGDVVVHAGGEAGVAIALEGVGGEGDDAGLALGGEVGADLAGGLEAVHLGHLEVHENEVVGAAFEGAEGFEAVGDSVGAVAEAFEEAEGDLLVNEVVFDDEDGERDGFGELIDLGGGAGDGAGGIEEKVTAEGAEDVGGADGAGEAGVGRAEVGGGCGGLALGVEPEDGEVEGTEAGGALGCGAEEGGVGDEEGGAGGGGGGEQFLEVGGVGGGEDGAELGGDLFDEAEAVEGVALEEEDDGGLGGRGLGKGVGGGGRGAEGEGEVEGGALADGAVDADGAAHEFDEALADDEAEAGAAVFAGGGGVDLGEGAEEAVDAVGGDADAGVVDDELDGAGAGGEDLDGDGAGGGELDGVVDEVGDDLAEAGGVELDPGGEGGVDAVGEVEAAGGGEGGEEVEGLLDEGGEVEGDVFELEATGLDFGEIEDVVDDGEEGLAGLADGVDGVALVGGEGGVEEEAGHADDAVHRGADLVRHGGEEVALGAGGGVGLDLGAAEFALGLDALGDVGGEEDVVFEASVGGVDGLEVDGEVVVAAGAGAAGEVGGEGVAGGEGEAEAVGGGGIVGGEEFEEGEAGDFGEGVAEEAGEGVVDPVDGAVGAGDDDDVVGAGGDEAELAFGELGGAEGGLGLAAFLDLAAELGVGDLGEALAGAGDAGEVDGEAEEESDAEAGVEGDLGEAAATEGVGVDEGGEGDADAAVEDVVKDDVEGVGDGLVTADGAAGIEDGEAADLDRVGVVFAEAEAAF